MEVAERFHQLTENVKLTTEQRNDGNAARNSVCRCLNQHYYGWNHETANSMFIGSWGKDTQIRPPRDVDVLFRLPKSVYDRFQGRFGNRQSQLLQEVRGVLLKKFSRTDVRGDGPVVLVPFSAYNVELVPAFDQGNGSYFICITSDGGQYKAVSYDAELSRLVASNNRTNGNTRNLIRMMKCWQGVCNVALKSFWIEIMAIDFLETYQYATNSMVYYDWMTRDFFTYIISRANRWVSVPGTVEMIYIGDDWKSKAETAKRRSEKACEYEAQKDNANAGTEWQKIFGTYIPIW